MGAKATKLCATCVVGISWAALGCSSSGEGDVGPSRSADTPLYFAVIGDYGSAADPLGSLVGDEDGVANLITGKNVDFIVTTGDNNYPSGAASTIDGNIGQFYASFIGSYTGQYGPGSDSNRFWPSPGNHDWNTPGLGPYLDYFSLPGNERYYEVDLGLVHLFAVDSDGDEPDGTTPTSVQGQWLQSALAASSSCFKLVYFHHPAYSSGDHGSSVGMQWPFEEWGADVVLTGHDHDYERLQVGGIPYFVTGLGGAGIYQFSTPLPESQARYNAMHGALFVRATSAGLEFEFNNVNGEVIDTHSLPKQCD
jgi:tartrate-resistant acid phosphatase type 5